jgi:hypothetical protein
MSQLGAVEQAVFQMGYVRCPNSPTRWYPKGPGIAEAPGADLHIVYAAQHAPEARIVIVPQLSAAPVYPFKGAIVMLRDTLALEDWLKDHGRLSR